MRKYMSFIVVMVMMIMLSSYAGAGNWEGKWSRIEKYPDEQAALLVIQNKDEEHFMFKIMAEFKGNGKGEVSGEVHRIGNKASWTDIKTGCEISFIEKEDQCIYVEASGECISFMESGAIEFDGQFARFISKRIGSTSPSSGDNIEEKISSNSVTEGSSYEKYNKILNDPANIADMEKIEAIMSRDDMKAFNAYLGLFCDDPDLMINTLEKQKCPADLLSFLKQNKTKFNRAIKSTMAVAISKAAKEGSGFDNVTLELVTSYIRKGSSGLLPPERYGQAEVDIKIKRASDDFMMKGTRPYLLYDIMMKTNLVNMVTEMFK